MSEHNLFRKLEHLGFSRIVEFRTDDPRGYAWICRAFGFDPKSKAMRDIYVGSFSGVEDCVFWHTDQLWRNRDPGVPVDLDLLMVVRK